MYPDTIETCVLLHTPIILDHQHDNANVDTQIPDLRIHEKCLNVIRRVYVVPKRRNADETVDFVRDLLLLPLYLLL